ncbi:MAG: hypothetical protein XD98_0334 [Microgenomates bacterium 39_6]|nr:MAG: hypothetical protein XD98_0334 [Microgenomates bacterium 39_6]
MPRKQKVRKVGFSPQTTYFKPRGIPLSSLQEVNLNLDELEALRLVDLSGQEQITAAKQMDISQSTLQRILVKAHKKVAQALVCGFAIKIKGGEVIMAGFGRGRGQGQGGGRGRMGGSFAAGPGGTCLCTNPDCQHEMAHQAGVPCYQAKCPKCGSPMVRKR